MNVASCSSCDFSWIRSISDKDNIFNTINGAPAPNKLGVFDVINAVNQAKTLSKEEIINDPAYVNMYLQYGNQVIKDLAMEIVNQGDSDDVKMQKIQEWVVRNIQYMEDKAQYGFPELWVPPSMLLNSKKGDCEDGAFLIMSLALNAGVEPDRLRFYAGEVKAGEGAATGGHGWVAYQRDSDREWVIVDFSYYPDLRDMDKRLLMKDDTRYIDDWFVMEVGKVILTPENNRVRNPGVVYSNTAYIQPNVLLPGTWMNAYA